MGHFNGSYESNWRDVINVSRETAKLEKGEKTMTVKVEKATTAFFANKVRKALHKKIKGFSNCWVQDDVLIADIQPLGIYTYHFTISEISSHISHGLTAEQVAKDIIKGYRDYILSEHFYFK